MSDNKTISVAMAVYNGERFLREQLDSILVQLHDDDELIVSYDESTDDTLKIITEYALQYKQVKLVRDPGKGVFSNFENAINEASGDYIFISDQDDIWVEGKRRGIVEDFSRLNVNMVIHNAVHVDEKGRRVSKDFFTAHKIKNGRVRNFLKPRYSGCCIAFENSMKTIVLPFPKNVGAYDHWVGMVGEVFGKVFFDKRVFLEHRLHGNNVTVPRRPMTTVLRVRWNLLKELVRLKKRRKKANANEPTDNNKDSASCGSV